MSLRPHDLPLRLLDAKIYLKISILYFWNINEALSRLDNIELKNHGAESSGAKLETPGCKNY